MVDLDEFEEMNENLVYLGDPPSQYRDAIIGITEDYNHVVYSYDKFAKCLVKEGMTPEEADEWIGFNTVRSLPYMGECAPILMHELIS